MKQIVSVDGIKRYMTADFSVEVFDVVSSTNTIVKERAKQGERMFWSSQESKRAEEGVLRASFSHPRTPACISVWQ